jgi:hypothetical protein
MEDFSSGGYNLNPFSGISSPKETTFWEKCKETFFVFCGNTKKQGFVTAFLNTNAPSAIAVVILLLALSPLLLFLGPFFYMFLTAFREEKTETYPTWVWALAIFWALPVGVAIVTGLLAAAIGLVAAGVGIAVGVVAAALAIGFAVILAILPAIPLLILINEYLDDDNSNYINKPWWQWAIAIAFALPTIAAALAIIVPLAILLAALVVAIAITSFALTLVSMPLISMVHAFGGPTPKNHTTLWRSTVLNPSTWIMMTILATGISLLIQGVDPLTFGSAAGPLMIIQTVFASMATITALGALVYGAYRTGRWICYPQDKLPDEPGYITKYLDERWEWAKKHPAPAVVVWGLGALGLIVVVGLTIDYFTGGALFGSLMAPVFEFMSQGFLSSIHAIFGSAFLGSLSDATLLLIGQIVSTITLISAAVLIPDNVSRFLEAMTTVDEAVIADRGDFAPHSPLVDDQAKKQGLPIYRNIYYQVSNSETSSDDDFKKNNDKDKNFSPSNYGSYDSDSS